MGEVISFPKLKQPARTREREGAAPQILFFTGVRYQRMSEPPRRTGASRPTSSGGMGKGRRKRG
jgi:hypothetical protein